LLARGPCRIQLVLAQREFDAWLFYDHHHRDPIAYRILGLLEELPVSRRWFYVIPAQGNPWKLVEPEHLDSLPGTKETYSAWRELADQLKTTLAPFPCLAMQYSPNNLIFYVGMVDAGTVEMVRSFGHDIVSSGDLIAYFEVALSDEQIRSHFRARDKIDAITEEAFHEIGRRVRDGGATEFDIQEWIMQAFLRENVTTAGDKSAVAVNEHSSVPHYAPAVEQSAAIRDGDFVLLDIRVKESTPDGVFCDITWTESVGQPSARQREIFAIVKDARGSASQPYAPPSPPEGRSLVAKLTASSATSSVAMATENTLLTELATRLAPVFMQTAPTWTIYLEIKDEREIIPNTCFSVEPGIYMPEFGVRSEVNVLGRPGSAEVTGRVQSELVII